MLLAQLSERFFADGKRRRRWKPKRADSMNRYVQRFLSFETDPDPELNRPATGQRSGQAIRAMSALHADQLLRPDVEAWLWAIGRRRGRGGKPLTITQVKEHSGALGSMLTFGRDLGILDDDRLVAIQRARLPEVGKNVAPPRKVTAIPDETLDRLIEFCTHKVKIWTPANRRQASDREGWRLLTLAVILLRHTGMRPDELLRLSASELRWLGEAQLYQPGLHKSVHHGHGRSILLNDSAQAALFEAMEILERDGQVSFSWVPVFGRRWKTANSVYQFIRRALREAGLGSYSTYQIRHRFGTNGVRHDLNGTREQMGHTTYRTTLRYVDDEGQAASNLVRSMDQG